MVGTATRYMLDGPGIESQWGARFSAPVQTGPGTHPASRTGPFPWIKRLGRDGELPRPSSAEVEGIVKLHLKSTFGPTWPVLR